MGAGEWPGREAYLAGLGLKRKYVRSLVKVAIFMVDEQIGGDQAAGEEHGQCKEEHDLIAYHKRFLRQCVGGRQRNHQINQGADGGIKDRIAVSKPNPRLHQCHLIGLEGEALGIEPNRSGTDQAWFAEGSDHDKI